MLMNGLTLIYWWAPIAEFALPIVATALMTVMGYAIRVLLKRWNLDKLIKNDAVIDKYVGDAINWAEKKAKNKLDSVKGEDKKRLAVERIINNLEDAGIKEYTEELISTKIEAMLNVEDKLGK